MKNKINLTLILFLTSLSILAQPDKKMLKSIPNEAYLVVSLNTSNITEKIDLERIKVLPVIKTAFDKLKKGARKDSVTLKKFYQDPNSLGVALEPSITAFFHFTESENEDPIGFVGIMIPLSNGTKFDVLLKKILKEKYNEVKEGQGYKYINQNETVIACNKNFLTFYGALDYKGKDLLTEHLENIYNADPKKSLIANNPDYKAFVKRKNDISLWLDINKIEGLIKSYSTGLANNNMFSFQTSSAELEINFENGEITLTSKQHHTEEVQGLINESYSQRINDDLLKYVSTENLLGFAGISVNLEVIKEMYNDKYQDLYDTIYNGATKSIIRDIVDKDSSITSWRTSLNENNTYENAIDEGDAKTTDELKLNNQLSYEEQDSIWNKIYEREDSLEKYYYDGRDSIISSALNKYNLKKEDLWTLFTGDVLFASNGTFEVVDTFYTYEYIENQNGEWAYDEVQKTRTFPAPLFKLLIGINYGASVKMALNDVIGLMEQNFPTVKIEKQQDYFVIETKYSKIYLSVFNDKYILLTNNKDFLDKIETKEYKKNLANSTQFNYLTKEGPSFLYADINAILKKSEKGAPQQIELFKIFEETLTSFDAGARPDDRNGYSAHSSIKMSKPNDNAIHIIFDLANDIYLYYLSFK